MEWDNLHELLRSLYDDMMPLAGDMAAVAKGLAGPEQAATAERPIGI